MSGLHGRWVRRLGSDLSLGRDMTREEAMALSPEEKIERRRIRGNAARKRWYMAHPEEARQQAAATRLRRLDADRLHKREYMRREGKRFRERARIQREWLRMNDPRALWASQIERQGRARARTRGLAYELDVDFILSICPTHCPYFGLELVFANKGKVCPASATVDRIDSSLGYIKGNVEIISHRANSIKSYGTAEEHERIAARMRELERRR